MIKYALRCADGHAFDSWFASAAAFDDLAAGRRLACAVCGDDRVEKALMAPRVAVPARGPAAENGTGEPPAPVEASPRPLAAPASPAEAAFAEFRRGLEASSEDVGRRFVSEARAIHEGRAPERSIRGQARPAEARALLEEGVPVLPLPGPPARQVN